MTKMHSSSRFIAALGVIIVVQSPANAEDLVLRTYHPVRVALQEFFTSTFAEAQSTRIISQTIASDLKQSGKFTLIDHLQFDEKYASFDELPVFTDWSTLGAQELIVGRASHQADGRIRAEFRIYDVPTRTQLAGRSYIGAPKDVRRMGHVISEDIYQTVIGEKRAFQIP